MVFQTDPCVKWQLRANYNEMLRDEISIQLRVNIGIDKLEGRRWDKGETRDFAVCKGTCCAARSGWCTTCAGWSSEDPALDGKRDGLAGSRLWDSHELLWPKPPGPVCFVAGCGLSPTFCILKCRLVKVLFTRLGQLKGCKRRMFQLFQW